MRINTNTTFSIMRTMLLLLAVASLTGCYRGRPSEQPPIHLMPDMDAQPKYKTMAESSFYADKSSMRLPVDGTVARGNLHEDREYYTGMDAAGMYIQHAPVQITRELLQRGRERFDIYCTPCHSRIGNGNGIINQYGYLPPGNLHDERFIDIEDGYFFDVITNGIRNMPSYRHQIPVKDRWAIVGYIRALQRSQRATAEEVPASVRQ
jgi:hypothetical protein